MLFFPTLFVRFFIFFSFFLKFLFSFFCFFSFFIFLFFNFVTFHTKLVLPTHPSIIYWNRKIERVWKEYIKVYQPIEILVACAHNAMHFHEQHSLYLWGAKLQERESKWASCVCVCMWTAFHKICLKYTNAFETNSQWVNAFFHFFLFFFFLMSRGEWRWRKSKMSYSKAMKHLAFICRQQELLNGSKQN